ncbi:CHRD domain-containing protein [uncultured Shewanella sp.]|uniref:CHRD domain-containing protein n=1 Tax=uncultured Shewanella sp. TaxID=173975 RepID=UPI0026362B53|nr:CHRD domain-containing protein [uncultured Shewanella sp.]
MKLFKQIFLLAFSSCIFLFSNLSAVHAHGHKGGSAEGQAAENNFLTFKVDLSPRLEKQLDGKAVEPNTPKGAMGMAVLSYDIEKANLHFFISYAGLSGEGLVMAHFHSKDKQGNPIVQTICGQPEKPGMVKDWPKTKDNQGREGLTKTCPSGNSGYLKGKWEHMEPSAIEELKTGKMNINLHTKLNMKGEIDGYITVLSQ